MDAPHLPRPPRRPRPTSGGGLGCLLVLASPFLLIGLGFVAKVAVRLWVQHEGTPVTVVVDGTTVQASTRRRGSTSYHVQYHYDWAGRRVADEQFVTADERDRAVVGSRVGGRVWSPWGHPICLADVGSINRQTASDVGGTAVFAGLPLLIGAVAWSARRRKRWLLTAGSAVFGEVTSARRDKPTSAIQTVGYRFHGPAGMVDATQLVGDSERGDTPVEVGQRVTVLYDPGRPTRSVIYEWSGYTVDQA
jgi:hypothetical protein